jgi:crotonobetainyl-CoA:carnitine CoA-transferase CaiB-like acyl-CoA transferase
MISEKHGALSGVKVIGLDQVVAMPSCCAILADWGADVVKVEPLWGEWQRSLVSFLKLPLLFHMEKGDVEIHFEALNRNKRSVALNLREEKGKQIMYRLLEDADVLVTNYSIEVIERFGLDYTSIKERFPRLIHCLLTGYGTKGPLARERGYDYSAAWSYGGLMHLVTAEPENPPPLQRPGMLDTVTGAHMLAGICAALYSRERTGRGQSLELSLYNTAVWTLLLDVQTALFGYPAKKWDRRCAPNPMYNSYRSRDNRWFIITNPNHEYWPPFCRAIGKPEWENDPRYATMESREDYCEEIIAQLDGIFASKEWAEWQRLFKENDLIAAINQTTTEIINDEQALANDFFTEIEHPVAGKTRLVNSPVRFSETPASIREAAPPLGAHTEEVLLELGYSWEDISLFKERGAIP